ncbi:MAG: 4-diphosphocytidyl-2-C-methyl-D-erythritol kinase [Eubacteriales bacterium SKADARSKE-1]|nr:4-diphosphocytidyl-2-C-methyl-D-erythritol kinase [Eubacteriales bacterium SKADARSKE-1]
MSLVVKAPAKINLYLDILKKCDNEYHNVEMIMQTVSLHDTISVNMSKTKEVNIFSNHRFSADIKKNTAYKAAISFFDYTNIENPGLNIKIEKKIPVCAGLAGGSSDAAAVLVALNQMFSTNLSKSDLALIGKKVGADVPFCIFGGTMLAKGIGTKLLPLTAMPDCYMVLCKPNIYVSTKLAYNKVDEMTLQNSNIIPMLKAVGNKKLEYIAKNLYNKFECVLRLNEVFKIKNIMIKNGAMGSSMSGSGPTVFGIFHEKCLAKNCTIILKKYYRDVFLCTSQKNGCEII